MVRLCAIRVVLRLAAPDLVSLFVKSDWNANALDPATEKWETYYGSRVLILSNIMGLISVNECVQRITISTYAELVRRVGGEAATVISSHLDLAIAKASKYEFTSNLPEIELWINGDNRPGALYIQDRLDHRMEQVMSR